MNRTPGNFNDHSTGRAYIALSEAARRLDRHHLSLYDEIKLCGIPLITISGCQCIAVDDLLRLKSEVAQ
ncbi:hypothetical protein [Marinobacter halophilus]|uniref:DNA-binding protein n=1 Tax=Marinobacter halophilus TaxID=1323740 RepID=A0A2T1K8P7_9GAMM|nr:hypothetical protein [Marinobacter halophilus]PSF06521.1 hypothetical protein C7H08_15580 [Marinobacter halophilus]GGC73328.1 hypothetical protein GCM10011362_22310 [Marinobacter halophilus]